jgi:hypothetical protein
MLKVYTLNDVPNKSQLMFKKQKDKGGKLVLKRTGLALCSSIELSLDENQFPSPRRS